MFKLSQRSKERLVGVHPDLVKVVHRALELTRSILALPKVYVVSQRKRNMLRKVNLRL